MASELKVDTIKHTNNTSAITLDSSGNVTLAGSANNLGTISAGTLGSSVVFPAGGTGNPISVAVIADEKSTSNAGGNLGTSFTRRDLNTILSDSESASGGIVSISSNQFTLGAGTYLITWSCPAYKVNRHITQLYDVTSTNVLTEGQTAFSGSATDEIHSSTGAFVHTISSNNVYEIRQATQTARSNDGGGLELGGNFTVNNIYTYVVIYKLK